MTSDRPGPSSRLLAALIGFALLLVGVVVGVTPAIAASAPRPTAVTYTYDSAPHVAQSRDGVPAAAAAVSPRARSGWATLTSQSWGRPYGSAVAAEGGVGGGGTIFTHFTDETGAVGISGTKPLAVGQSVGVDSLKFGQGSNSFLAKSAGDNFVTDLGIEATPGQLNGIGVFGSKQQYALQFSEESAANSGVRLTQSRPNVFALPGGSCISGACVVTRIR